MSEIGTDIGFLPASVLNVIIRFPLETSTCDTIPSLMNAVASISASVVFALFLRRIFLEFESYVPLYTASEARALFVIALLLSVMNPKSFVKSEVLDGIKGMFCAVIYPESLVRSEVLDGIFGISDALINPESFVKSEVFVGRAAEVMYPASFLKALTTSGTFGRSLAVINLESFVRSDVLVGS